MPYSPKPQWSQALAAANWLLEEQSSGKPFVGLPTGIEPKELMHAYAVQDALLGLMVNAKSTEIGGYKIAITTPAMQTFVGFDDAISGCVLANAIHPSGCLIKESNFQHLIIEFELALQFGQDLPFRSEPWTAQSIGPMVECAYPCLELADDRYARYDHLKAHFFTLVAENAWNHGVVLGSRIEARNFAKLWQTLGVAKVNGEMIGHGRSQDVMGHPLKALAWLANEIQRRGRPILAGQWVTTGSWVASTFPHAGQTLSFVFEDMAEVCVHIV